ncbi:UDP-glycosyltransferase [uncultured Dokdonia sp.]|uniref:UDP-glycosyltransferase n=1 Tax=uncultured Dokdonia sp. TaxID=575653 RepID=UPI002619A24D|nr:UDP-glycosyltransferase [uncultured Dokdonia sp.]
MSKKVLVLLPDGVSLRNFAYTSFYKKGLEKGHEVLFWNHTPFDLEELGFNQVVFKKEKPHWLTDVLKTACIRIELNLFSQRDSDDVYQSYKFPLPSGSLKGRLKKALIKWFCYRYGSESGLLAIRKRMMDQERKTTYYRSCKAMLQKEQPDILFCASQRSVIAISPITAAQDLDIPTVSYIFSWDNVPKATTVVTTDHYFVWSDHMKNELLHYQRYIQPEQIIVTGTPQFEPHFQKEILVSKEAFFKEHGLDLTKKYICFSGDDITTSPKDELYLRDIASAVRSLNERGVPLGIIFRRCPVDFSTRYDAVIETYKDVIVVLPPLWNKIGEGWNTILPTREDLVLQVNLIAHTEFVVNLGSSMVFDYATAEKPCAYLNYNYLNTHEAVEAGVYIYDFVHFRSMPSPDAVVWLDHPDTIADSLETMLQGVPKTITAAQDWFRIINKQPAIEAPDRIWDGIEKLTKN